MATNRPCRFTKTELSKLLKSIPETERRLIVKLKHYIKEPIKTLYEEDKAQRIAAAGRNTAATNVEVQ